MENQTGLQRSTMPSGGCLETNVARAVNYPERIRQNAVLPTVTQRQDNDIAMMIIRLLFLLCVPKDNYPTKNETDALIAFIREKQSKFSCESIVTAFELYIDRQLDITPKEFIRFGPMLISDVMQSYTRYAFNTLHRPTEGDTPDEADKERMTKTPEQLEAEIKNTCVATFHRYRDVGKLFDPGNFQYHFLVRHGLLNFSQERKKEIRGRVNQLNLGIFHKAISGDKDQEERLKMAARELALMEFFNDLIETGTELSEMFENSTVDVRSK